MTPIPPVRRELLVDADPATAFELFTAHIGAWWPLGTHSIHGARASVAFEGDRLVERLGSAAAVWGEVLEWDPPHRLRLRWHPGRAEDQATEVAVAFSIKDDRALVTLEHTGWEQLAEPAASADDYRTGWPSVLEAYRAVVESPAAGSDGGSDEGQVDGERWYLLQHRPGPEVAAGGSVFAHPLFAEHAAFLDRQREAGRLVAAGPLVDTEGEGATVLRVPAGDDVDVEVLATTDDRSVAGGCLEVAVRPWRVLVSS